MMLPMGAARATPEGLGLRMALVMSPPVAQQSDAVLRTSASATPWPDLLAWAHTQAPSNRVADAGAQAALAQGRQAWSTAWMPRLDASAGANRQQQTYNGLAIRTPASSVSLTATLPLWRAADRAVARAQSAAAEQTLWQARNARSRVARELSRAYLAAVEQAEQMRLTESQQQGLLELTQVNDRRLKAGVGTVLDVLETRIRVDQTRAAVQDYRTRLVTQRLTLLRLTGQGNITLPAGLLPTLVKLPLVVPPREQAVTVALDRNPQLQEAQAQVVSAKATTDARDGERWHPTVDAVALASRSRQTQQFDGNSEQQNITTRSIGVQINWPLFTGGFQHQRVQEAAALLTQSEAQRDDARTQLDANLNDAYQSLEQLNRVIAVQRQVEQSAMASAEAVRKAFMAGMRTNLDVLNAQQQVYATRQSLVTTRVNALSAQVDILALLDQLDAPTVAPLMAAVDTRALPDHPTSELVTP